MEEKEISRFPFAYTFSPAYRGHLTQSIDILYVERDNPNEVSVMSKLTARKAESLSGCRMSQEANAGSRKATGIHNWPDRVMPNPKGC